MNNYTHNTSVNFFRLFSSVRFAVSPEVVQLSWYLLTPFYVRVVAASFTIFHTSTDFIISHTPSKNEIIKRQYKRPLIYFCLNCRITHKRIRVFHVYHRKFLPTPFCRQKLYSFSCLCHIYISSFQYVLNAATSPATRMSEETLTYLNQGLFSL